MLDDTHLTYQVGGNVVFCAILPENPRQIAALHGKVRRYDDMSDCKHLARQFGYFTHQLNVLGRTSQPFDALVFSL